ncbi:MAG: hypothetical protein DLM72_20565 [Candidatus Nitrosopolaris wilkensis]|nr:MAG: hypothetical protein DLM72_20565 [Candidatus Nitrosopolaris wilkensis]
MTEKKTMRTLAERRTQLSAIDAAILIGFFISSQIVMISAAAQTTLAPAKTRNNSAAMTGNNAPTLGNPSVIYIESDKSSVPLHPVSVNGTHAQATAFTGNGTLAGIPDTDTGTAYFITRPDGSVYTFGNGAVVSKVGNGILTYTFDAIGHYLPDGKLHDTGHIIVKSTSGNLDSLSEKIGLYKDWYDASGNGMTTMWFWN